MCLLCAYTTRMVSGWPMPRGQPAIVDGASVGESAPFELCERAPRGTLRLAYKFGTGLLAASEVRGKATAQASTA